MNGNYIDHGSHGKEGKAVAFSEATMGKIREVIAHYPEGQQKSALLPILHMAQEELGGHLSVDVMDYVASLLGIQPIEVYEVATFYTMFHLEKTGRYVIEVCRTNPCAMCGGEDITRYLMESLGINVGETTADGLFTLKESECMGACGYAPVVQVNSSFREQMTREKVDLLLEELRKNTDGTLPGQIPWAESFS
jgi:NADH-quinone oxidoreductase subunit E